MRANGIVVDGHFPRIFFELAQAEGNLLLFLVDVEDNRLDFVADLENLGGLGDALGPGEFGDVDEPFDALFKLDERAVGRQIANLAAHVRANGILALDVFPRVGGGLFEAEGDALALGVDFDYHHGDFFAHLEHFARVRDPAPAHVGDVQEAVEAVEIDERAVVGDVLHNAPAYVAGLDFGEQVAALFGALLLNELAAGDDDVLALRVDFDDFEIVGLADVLVEILGRLHVDLGSGQEGVHADADDEPALDFALDSAGEDGAFLAVGEDFLPVLFLLGLVVGYYGIAFAVLEFFEKNLDFLSDLDVVDVREFAHRHDAFGFSAYVDYDFVLADFYDFALYDRALFEFGKAAVGQQFFHYVVHLCP